jgi:hypothetical protein
MRILSVLICMSFGVNLSAQFSYEHTYDSASTASKGGTLNQLMIVKFEVSGERYVKIDQWSKQICLYDMNHSLLKTISFAGFPDPSGYQPDILYISEGLFNTDPKMEYMYSVHSGSGSMYTGVYNEDGLLLFSDTGLIAIRSAVELQQYPIYNTSQGTKMILRYPNGQAKVFGLGGKLSTSIATQNQSLLRSNGVISNAYPNPTQNVTTIEYELPPGMQQGDVVFYDLRGKEIRRFKVDSTFKSLLLSTSDIPAGTYYYQLQTSYNISIGKKLVVIK